MNPVISFDACTFGYGGDALLRDVGVSVPEGDFVSVVGPNGSGKTTLLKLVLGLLTPSRGSVSVFGQTPAKARHRIGYVPQHPQLDPLFPVSALDVALMGRLGIAGWAGPWQRREKEAARAALDEVGLAHRAEDHYASLSGGQKQRALIARALACEPDLLLLDEPTAGLDAHVEEGFYRLLQDLNRRLTVVLVSHDLGFVSSFVKSVICVGQKVVIHPTSAITGEVIAELYGTDMNLVRHDHRCSEEGHEC